MTTQTVKIQSMGAQGDGIAHCPDGTVYVPFSLPGETVAIARVKDHGTIMSISEASAQRREPLGCLIGRTLWRRPATRRSDVESVTTRCTGAGQDNFPFAGSAVASHPGA